SLLMQADADPQCPEGVTGGCRRQADGTAGLPSAPEMPSAPRQLRLVPRVEVTWPPPLAHIGRGARVTRLPLEPAFSLGADLIQIPASAGARSWNATDSAILILRFQPSVSAVTACRGSMVRRTTRSRSPPFAARSISGS